MKTSGDYQGDGITIRMTRSDGTYVWQDFPVQGTEWHHVVWTFDEVDGARKLTMAIEGKEGHGKLFFSDFSLEKGQ